MATYYLAILTNFKDDKDLFILIPGISKCIKYYENRIFYLRIQIRPIFLI